MWSGYIIAEFMFYRPFMQSMGMEIRVADKNNINIIEGNNVYLSQLFGIFHTSGGESV